jgi:excisionase family DNA binding protein
MANDDDLPPRECFTLKQAAPLLGISVPTIRKRIYAGMLRARKEGSVVLLDREEIDRYKASRPFITPRTRHL